MLYLSKKFSHYNKQPKQFFFPPSKYECETDSKPSKIMLALLAKADNQLKIAQSNENFKLATNVLR